MKIISINKNSNRSIDKDNVYMYVNWPTFDTFLPKYSNNNNKKVTNET